MATINFVGNTYAGEVLEDLLVYASHSNDTYEAGLIHVMPGVQYKYVLPHLTIGSIIQDNKPTPTSTQGAANSNTGFNEYKLSERYLEPMDFMVYLEFNPRDFEKYWKFAQPDKELVFRELDPLVQMKFAHLLLDRKDQYINDAIWGSQKGGVGTGTSKVVGPANAVVTIGGASEAGPMKYWDGVIVRLLNNISASASNNEKASGTAVLAGNTVLSTGQAVESALYTIWQKTPSHVRKSKKFKFVMNWATWDLYDQYLTSQGYKYTENPEENKRRFKNRQIVVIDGVPDSTILFGKFTSDEDSCLWMGVDYSSDQEALKVERLQANSEIYFFQMRMKVDVNIVRPGEIVFWTPYKYAPASD